jgi:outer membrane receptor protein involved in Fe transport
MIDLPFTAWREDLRLTGGARVEDSDQVVYSIQNKLFPARQDTARIDTRDVLPSAALTWLYDEDTNVRLGYYESVNRPEFREISPILRRDYRTFENQRGNPDLKRALIRNYDLRVEHFPGPGEVLAASAFYKRMADATEDTLLPEAERPTATFTSTPLARNWGFELEAGLKLDWLDYTKNVSLSANYTRVWSEVVFDNPRTLEVVEQNKRPLQGQAPWSVNVSLLYDNPGSHTTFNVMANRIGRRLDKLAENMFEYVYLEPRTKLDVVATQQLAWSLKLKLAVIDLLAQNTVKTSATEAGDPYVYSDLSESTTYALSISGKF